MNELVVVAFWGLLGAAAYAGPVLSACLFGERRKDHPVARCWFDAFVAVFIGSFAAAAFSSWVGGFLHQPDVHAVAAVMGLLSNFTVPLFESMFADKVTAIVKALVGAKP